MSLLSVVLLMLGAVGYACTDRFERIYTPQGAAHLTIKNMNGDIRVNAWDRKTINVRAITLPPAKVEDRVSGNEFTISVKRHLPPGAASFEVSVPANTSITLSNVMGKIEVNGVAGDVAVDSIDGEIRLQGIRAASVDVKVTAGNIFFEGDLLDGGSCSLQAVKGDIDVTLPAATPFDLNARSLSGAINIGDFINNLMGGSKLRKNVSGTHLRGGARLSLTTFSGRVLLHKK
ncbi:MAG TPA: DUF4097 family beta strand repeat-containing protein [Blastocatellia bacterium]|jgi:DUF4097 and DUF4098 domain-containing protein YvlB|nr:DUF4097 family beta strand repeat-containing protein [Blastocatellia bacterium]